MPLPHFFDFYSLPVSFFIDEKELKKRFFAFNKQFHPDFHTLATPETQQQNLEMATYNNKAYETLLHFDQRVKYILELNGLLHEGEKYTLPSSFLMEMMELNETLMELQAEPDANKVAQLLQAVNHAENNLLEEVLPAMKQFAQNPGNTQLLTEIKDFYYKKRYLLRIKESLSKFASA
ncbi:Fe-S protein assembly co-chaperone HscB [Sphingobacteriales bacterium UPWRP_1]|nr:Fe-S protein assembly co-chaperone HscB [Sphingobacteriales bacterium TSM_CSS]PSJ75521.1 Fe-S protein assembly co-chaperone HscB [Sphingobacteriales bacterium UPWRP_1]